MTDWLTSADSLGMTYAVCRRCGAMVVSEGKAAHDEFHQMLEGVTGADCVQWPERDKWADAIMAMQRAREAAKNLTE